MRVVVVVPIPVHGEAWLLLVFGRGGGGGSSGGGDDELQGASAALQVIAVEGSAHDVADVGGVFGAGICARWHHHVELPGALSVEGEVEVGIEGGRGIVVVKRQPGAHALLRVHGRVVALLGFLVGGRAALGWRLERLGKDLAAVRVRPVVLPCRGGDLHGAILGSDEAVAGHPLRRIVFELHATSSQSLTSNQTLNLCDRHLQNDRPPTGINVGALPSNTDCCCGGHGVGSRTLMLAVSDLE